MSNIKYTEDIATVAAGTELYGAPLCVREITVSLEEDKVAIVNFSDSKTSYDSGERVFKVAIDGPMTLHFPFADGLELENGLCATANNGSVDVSITYD